MASLYLCGAGNPEGVRLALRINQIQSRWDRIIILDDDPSKHGQSILGVEIAGSFTELKNADPASDEVSNLVARTTKVRLSALKKIKSYRLRFTPLIDPGSDMTGVEFGNDITVYPGAQFCANATVGDGLVVLVGALVGHGCRLGQCCIVAPGAVINARVELGDGVYVGTNASILPDLKIGPSATIGANSAVVQDIPAGATVMGVPAQLLMPGTRDFHDESPYDLAVESQDPGQTEIRSEALSKLRIAQEKFMKAHRSKKH